VFFEIIIREEKIYLAERKLKIVSCLPGKNGVVRK
jgi:hypothetical protein